MEQRAHARAAHLGPVLNGTTAPRPLIERAELAALLARPTDQRPVLLDVRWELGRARQDNVDEYLDGHLPDAVFVDLDADLSGPVCEGGGGGRHPMPDPDRFQDTLRSLGVREDRGVVVYDAGLSLGAARAWWLLQWAGKHDARVLEGGYSGWVAGDGDVETGEMSPRPGDVTVRPGGRQSWSAEEVASLLQLPGGEPPERPLLDARPAVRYRGDEEPVDPVAGHVPGARNLPALSLVDRDGRFIGRERLRERLRALGVGPTASPVLYCGSGVQAAHAALAWEAAFPEAPQPGVYVGSWSDWISDPARPVARGEDASGT